MKNWDVNNVNLESEPNHTIAIAPHSLDDMRITTSDWPSTQQIRDSMLNIF